MTTPSNPNSTPDSIKEQKRLAENERMRLWRLAHKNDENYRLRRNEREKNRRRNLMNSEQFRSAENERQKEWSENNREKRRKIAARWREKNRGNIRDYARKYNVLYAQKNRDSIRYKELQRVYGITKQHYDSIFDFQDGKCAICRNPFESKGKRRACIDHDHSTGKIRGILCNMCNMMIGHADENKKTLEMAIAYLDKHSSSS
jgi:hypothetical protein